MHPTLRKRYMAWPLQRLRKLRDDILSIIDELEALPDRRDVDIAAAFTGDPALVHEVDHIIGKKDTGKWVQLQKIYCSLERCPECPHGWYLYRYRSNKKRGTVSVEFLNKPGFSPELMKTMSKSVSRPPVGFEIRPLPDKAND